MKRQYAARAAHSIAKRPVLECPATPSCSVRLRNPCTAANTLYPDALIVPSLANGATDSRSFEGLSNAIYRFAPYILVRADVPSIHGTTERVAIADLLREVQVYRTLLRSLAGH